MRDDLDGALARELRDLPGDREATATGQIGLEDVDVPVLYEAAEGADRRVGLPGGDSRGDGG